MIKAIETRYKGYRFRSRLEARWATLLDELGFNWVYEDEGYQLSNGAYYLPDFYLPDQNAWIEIKGGKAKDSELEKCRLLALGMSGGENMLDLLCTGQTDLTWSFMDKVAEYMQKENLYTKDAFFDEMSEAINRAKDRHKVYLFEGLMDDGWLCISPYSIQLTEPWRAIFFLGRSVGASKAKIELAIRKAKSARFEHGESPR